MILSHIHNEPDNAHQQMRQTMKRSQGQVIGLVRKTQLATLHSSIGIVFGLRALIAMSAIDMTHPHAPLERMTCLPLLCQAMLSLLSFIAFLYLLHSELVASRPSAAFIIDSDIDRASEACLGGIEHELAVKHVMIRTFTNIVEVL